MNRIKRIIIVPNAGSQNVQTFVRCTRSGAITTALTLCRKKKVSQRCANAINFLRLDFRYYLTTHLYILTY